MHLRGPRKGIEHSFDLGILRPPPPSLMVFLELANFLTDAANLFYRHQRVVYSPVLP
jgi:hypothetical protein